MLDPNAVLEYLKTLNDDREIVIYFKDKLEKYLKEEGNDSVIQETLFQITLFIDLNPLSFKQFT